MYEGTKVRRYKVTRCEQRLRAPVDHRPSDREAPEDGDERDDRAEPAAVGELKQLLEFREAWYGHISFAKSDFTQLRPNLVTTSEEKRDASAVVAARQRERRSFPGVRRDGVSPVAGSIPRGVGDGVAAAVGHPPGRGEPSSSASSSPSLAMERTNGGGVVAVNELRTTINPAGMRASASDGGCLGGRISPFQSVGWPLRRRERVDAPRLGRESPWIRAGRRRRSPRRPFVASERKKRTSSFLGVMSAS